MAEIPFNESKQMLAARLSLHPSAFTCYRALLVGICHSLACLQPMGWAALPTAGLPYIIQPFRLPGPFVYSVRVSWLLRLVPLFPISPLHTWPSSVWSRPPWTPSDAPDSGYALPNIYNKPSLPSHLGAVMVFPFLFLFFFSIHLRDVCFACGHGSFVYILWKTAFQILCPVLN